MRLKTIALSEINLKQTRSIDFIATFNELITHIWIGEPTMIKFLPNLTALTKLSLNQLRNPGRKEIVNHFAALCPNLVKVSLGYVDDGSVADILSVL